MSRTTGYALLISIPALAMAACGQPDRPEAPAANTGTRDAAAVRRDDAAPRRPDGAETLEAYQARLMRGFDGLDADGDGVVTAAELDAASGGRAIMMMRRLDADGDGRVTREEMSAGGERLFRRMDVNGDGVLGGEERPASRPASPQG